MRMAKVKLSCGCAEIISYAGKKKFSDLKPIEQGNLRQAAIARHKCPKPPAKAPPTSPEPQKP